MTINEDDIVLAKSDGENDFVPMLSMPHGHRGADLEGVGQHHFSVGGEGQITPPEAVVQNTSAPNYSPSENLPPPNNEVMENQDFQNYEVGDGQCSGNSNVEREYIAVLDDTTNHESQEVETPGEPNVLSPSVEMTSSDLGNTMPSPSQLVPSDTSGNVSVNEQRRPESEGNVIQLKHLFTICICFFHNLFMNLHYLLMTSK